MHWELGYMSSGVALSTSSFLTMYARDTTTAIRTLFVYCYLDQEISHAEETVIAGIVLEF